MYSLHDIHLFLFVFPVAGLFETDITTPKFACKTVCVFLLSHGKMKWKVISDLKK